MCSRATVLSGTSAKQSYLALLGAVLLLAHTQAMSKVLVQQDLYDNGGDVVASAGDTVDLRDDVARWYVERGIATWPPKPAAKETKKEEAKA